MAIRAWLGLLLTIFLVGCNWKGILEPVPNDSGRYQLHAMADGKTLRLDTQTGRVSLVTDKGLRLLPDDRKIQLEVGAIYTLENGKSALYQGNQKLEVDTRIIADSLVEKYSDGMPTMKAVEAELARRKEKP
jgi:hypothetical protein